MSDLVLGRDRLGDLSVANGREWLVTNGIGGFAAGTVGGALTRRYHGLLVAALDPPLGRTLLVAKLGERLGRDGDWIDLSTDLWASGAVEPRGHRHLLSFHLEETIPVWTWVVAGARLEKRVWMEHGENTTVVEYALGADGHPATLSLRALVDHRDLHAITVRPDWRPRIEPTVQGLCVRMFDGATTLWLSGAGAEVGPGGDWYRDYALSAERERGFEWVEDHLMAGEWMVRLKPGERFRMVASTRPDAVSLPLASSAARSRRTTHERTLLDAWRRARPEAARAAPAWVRRLVLAADAYLVVRSSPTRRHGRSVIAGYPWFADWGRDAMVALPGLTLATGRDDVARAVLRTWAECADRGVLPDRFTEGGGRPEYHGPDASLWLFHAVRATCEATGDDALLAELFPVLEDIGAWFERGGRNGIGVDPRDGLLRVGAEGLALTWMDACVDGQPVTPRRGKPVEVNALWYNALTAMVWFARRLGRPHEAYTQMARRVRLGFARYWNPEARCLYDVIDGPRGPDAAVRPNQLLAVSLPESPLPAAQRRAVLQTCARSLLTPYGMRSLAPDDPGYRGRYAGDSAARDAAYHQGTAWVWLLPHFALAHHRVHRDREAALALLDPLGELVEHLALGQLPELVNGDPPHEPRGAIAQAWSVGEALRVWHELAAAAPRRATRRAKRPLSAVGAE